MPSPRWPAGAEPPILAAMAAAASEAWAGPEHGASARYIETLRQMIGPDLLREVEGDAISLFLRQPRAPGTEAPPPWAWFAICPGCMKLGRTRFTAPQNGRLRLQVLRDADWLDSRFAAGETTTAIAKRLGCCATLVMDWARKHGLLTPRARGVQEFDAQVRARHQQGDAPGIIARALDDTVQHVRQSLRRQGLATNKRGHHYFERDWWIERLERRGLSKGAAAREAGIRAHTATYYVHRFGLEHITRRNVKRGKPKKHPQLHDAEQLRALLARHETYSAAAAEVGCMPTSVSHAARTLLGAPKRLYPGELPHSRDGWWSERVERGATTLEIAAEAGIQEKSARERLRLLGLLPRAYANNVAAERRIRARAAA